jgi:hypothetical protein
MIGYKVYFMPFYRKNIDRSILIILLIFSTSISLFSQEVTSQYEKLEMPSMHLPRHDKSKKYRASIGLSMVQPPKDMVETAIQAPLFNYHMSYTLPWKFSLEGDISSLIVSNQLGLGPRFNLSSNNFGMKLGWDFAFVFGQLKQFGFNNTTKAWLNYPNISGSYQWKKMIFTLRTEIVYVSSVDTKTGENELTVNKNFYNGYTGAFYIEQRLHKNKVLIIGLKDSYVKYYWPVWLTFSTFNRFYHVPEISFSWII